MVPGRRNAKIFGNRDRKWRKDGGGARGFKMAVAGLLTGRQRWRPLRGKRSQESSHPRFLQSQEPSRSVSVQDCSTPFLHLSRPFSGPARLPRGHQARQLRSSSPRLGLPGRGPGDLRAKGGAASSVSAAVHPSVSTTSCLCSLTGSFRFDVFLYLESGSTVAMVSAVAAAVASLGKLGSVPLLPLRLNLVSPRFCGPVSLSFLLLNQK